jgi:hypothetical protein
MILDSLYLNARYASELYTLNGTKLADSPINGLWCCRKCSTNQTQHYDSFPSLSINTENDKFYDDERVCDDAVIQAISQVLDNYTSYSFKALNQAFRHLSTDTNITDQPNIANKALNFHPSSITLMVIELTLIASVFTSDLLNRLS